MAKFLNKHWKILLTAITAIALLNACYTDKKATKQITKAIEKKPLIAAKLTREAYPCITVASDTAIIYKDSLIEVDCPPNATEYFIVRDTLNRFDTIYKSVKVPIKVQLPSTVVTKYIEDSAKITLIAGEKRTLEDKLLLANNAIAKHVANENSLWWTFKHLFTFGLSWLILIITLVIVFRKQIASFTGTFIRKLINPSS